MHIILEEHAGMAMRATEVEMASSGSKFTNQQGITRTLNSQVVNVPRCSLLVAASAAVGGLSVATACRFSRTNSQDGNRGAPPSAAQDSQTFARARPSLHNNVVTHAVYIDAAARSLRR